MFALAVLAVLLLYLCLLFWATRRGWRWGIERQGWTGRKRYLGAAMGFLIVILPVFWDWIPTVAMHQYYCATESGFWIYKSLEQWKAENPGVMETLDSRLAIQLYDPQVKERFWTTQQFYTDVSRTLVFHAVSKTEEVFIDAVSHQPIARSVNFFRGQSGNVFATGGSFDDLRQALIFGWGDRECGNPSATAFLHLFRYEFDKMGENK